MFLTLVVLESIRYGLQIGSRARDGFSEILC